MNKLFQEYLHKKTVEYVEENHPEFTVLKSMPKGAGKSIIFKRKFGNGFVGYLQARYITDRDQIELNLQWSTRNRFPCSFCVDEAGVDRARCKLEELTVLEEAWVASNKFGLAGFLKIDVYDPDQEFLDKIYSEDNFILLREYMVEDELEFTRTNFFELLQLTGWDMIVDCFGREPFTDEELGRIIGSMLDHIYDFFSNYAVPYLSKIYDQKKT